MDTNNRGSPHILVLERDHPLAALLEEWLAAAGYRTLVVHSARVSALRSLGGLTAVLADLDGPRPVAIAEVRRLRQLFPETPIIVMSGYVVASGARRLARDLGVASVIAKPFSSGTLLAAVRQVSGNA